MHFAPPTCTQLDHVAGSLTSPNLNARVCCLFVNGAFGVWELDSRNELRAVSAEPVVTLFDSDNDVVCCYGGISSWINLTFVLVEIRPNQMHTNVFSCLLCSCHIAPSL